MEISGSRVIITGGASGIGLEIVKQLITNGAKKIVILDIDAELGNNTAKSLNKISEDKVIFIHCDISKKDNYEESFQLSVKKLGGLDILINNAGIMDENIWELEIQINVDAVARGTILAIKEMGIHQGGKGGAVVNVSSTMGLKSNPNFPVYSGTKAAVVSMVKAFGDPENMELCGVRVMAICPGMTNTRLLKEAHNPDDYENFKLLHEVQSPSFVALNIITMLKVGKSGDIFICESNKPITKYEIPDYCQM